MKLGTLLFFFFFLNPFFGRASECSCSQDDDLNIRHLIESDLMFKGHLVTKRTEFFPNLGYRYVATFFIDELISGTPKSDTVDIEFGYDYGYCSLYFYPGASYFIVANTSLDFPYYQTNYCSGNKKWEKLSKSDHRLLLDFQSETPGLAWKTNFQEVFAKGKLRDKKPVGLWAYFYSDGTIKEAGHYLNGKKEGEWLTFHHPLQICLGLQVQYTGRLCDLSQISPPNPAGWVSSVTPYTNGIISGTVLSYAESGCIRSEANYVNGVLVGPIQTY